MKHKKNHYRGMTVEGYKWQGYWDKFHHFVKKEDKGYLECRCTDQEIENGDLLFMIQHNLTR